MEQIYMMSAEQDLIAQIADELLNQGIARERLRVFALNPQPLPDMRVRVTRYHALKSVIGYGALAGILAGAVLWFLLMLDGYRYIPMAFLLITMGLSGAVMGMWFGHGLKSDLYRLNEALLAGAIVIVLDVEKPLVDDMERAILQRHPDVLMLGPHTETTPPFP